MVYAENTWYVTLHASPWNGTVVAATAEEAIERVWELLDARPAGRAQATIRTVEYRGQVFVREGSL